METIGIVGQGFVGTAVRSGMQLSYTVRTFDIRDRQTDSVRTSSLQELCRAANTIFVCVPTPMNPDGSADLSTVYSVVGEIASYAGKHTIVIKSTVPPGTTDELNRRYGLAGSGLQIVFNPEFLTEIAAEQDFKNQNRIIVGGPEPARTTVKQLYQKVFPTIPIIKTSSCEAEMIKYTTNTFLMTKVLFANEQYQICQKLNVDWDRIVECLRHDDRLGVTHWNVPGPDGKISCGGSCFPKDINALICTAEDLGVDPTILKAVWEKNIYLRPERDWELLKGRTVADVSVNEEREINLNDVEDDD